MDIREATEGERLLYQRIVMLEAEYNKERDRADAVEIVKSDLLKACEALGAFTRDLLKIVAPEQIKEARLTARMLKVSDQTYNAIKKARGE